MIVERAPPFDHQLSCTIIEYHQLSFSLSLFEFFMIVDDSFSRLTTRMIVHDSFSVSCFGNHRPDHCQKTCCRPLSSRKIHTFTSLSYGTPFLVFAFLLGEVGTRCSRDFACATAGELSPTITNFFGRLTIWTIVGDSWWYLGENQLSSTWGLVGFGGGGGAGWEKKALEGGHPKNIREKGGSGEIFK